jgi:hypothetical protein
MEMTIGCSHNRANALSVQSFWLLKQAAYAVTAVPLKVLFM